MKRRKLRNKFPQLDEKPYGVTYYGWDGLPMTLGQWVTMTEDMVQAVGQTYLRRQGDVYRVSTVLLGIDYSFGMNEKPLIFETMVFGPDTAEIFDRYATLRQARRGHRKVVAGMREMLAYQRNLRAGMIHNGRKGRKP